MKSEKAFKIFSLMAILLAFAVNPILGLLFTATVLYFIFTPYKVDRIFGAVGIRFSDAARVNSFDAQGGGINSTGATQIPYAAAISLPTPVKNALRHYYDFALLTGALTLNVVAGSITTVGSNGLPTSIGFQEGDEVILRFSSDATGRTITWGTNIRSTAATLVLTASQFAVVSCIFMDGKLVVVGSGQGV